MLSRAQEWPLQAKFAERSIVFDETGAVVATDLVPADAGCDNGTFLHSSPRIKRHCDDTAHSIVCESGERRSGKRRECSLIFLQLLQGSYSKGTPNSDGRDSTNGTSGGSGRKHTCLLALLYAVRTDL